MSKYSEFLKQTEEFQSLKEDMKCKLSDEIIVKLDDGGDFLFGREANKFIFPTLLTLSAEEMANLVEWYQEITK